MIGRDEGTEPEVKAPKARPEGPPDPGPRQRLRVLITNFAMTRFGGTESVVRDIALGLQRRGHFPVVYSPRLGEAGRPILNRGIPVIDSLFDLGEPPDIIHGHHFPTAGEAIAAFPDRPAVYICHGWLSWLERPPSFPHLLYAAVSETTRDRIVQLEGIDPVRVRILPNAVDLRRIPPRPRPLSRPRPLKAVVFSSELPHLDVIAEACRSLHIELDVLNVDGPLGTAEPERLLVGYDLVFGTGRSAIESLCCGSAVVVCDRNGLAALVTAENYERLRQQNFALRALQQPITVDALQTEIGRYDADAMPLLASRARSDADLEPYLDRLEAFYADAIASFQAKPPGSKEMGRAVGYFLHEALRAEGQGSPWLENYEAMVAELHRLRNLEHEHQRLIRSRSRLIRQLLWAITRRKALE